jgi:LuxR family maltose regulon positive regulatory protein
VAEGRYSTRTSRHRHIEHRGDAVTSDVSLRVETLGDPPAESDPLLASKFAVPEAPPFSVVRGRLVDRLCDSVRRPLTAVIGPPGCGKTQLVASWASSGRAPGPVIWITLEDGDDAPDVFWPYFVEGLRRSGIALSAPVDEAVRDGTFDRSRLVRLAADLAALRTPVVLVLDSVSVVADRQMADDLEAVLRHADQHLRIILVGRWDPPLPLYRYRLAGTLAEVRSGDLAFTAAEAAALLVAHGVQLPDEALTSLLERTEGWAAGLRLSAMAMQGSHDAESVVASIAGDDANIAEYFLGEVLSAQTTEIREFLLRTSIVDTFTLDLAETLSEQRDARHTLMVLERANAFVQPMAERSTVHRYHRLFAELLRAQLAYEDPAEVLRLHRRAAAWFAAHGRIADAVRHAAAGRDWEHASALLIQDLGLGRLVADGEADRLGKLFRDMPLDVDGPEPALVMAALRLGAGHPGDAEAHLARAVGFVDADVTEQTVPLRLGATLIEAVAATMQHDGVRAVHAADAAEALLAQAQPSRVAAHPELRAIILYSRGAGQSWTGALEDAVTTLTEGVRAGAPTGCEPLRLSCLEQLALVNAYLGRLQEAADVAERAVQFAGQLRQNPPHPSVAGTVVLAWVAGERWTVAAAWRYLRAAEAAADTCDEPLATVAVALVRARLLGGRGEPRVAARVLSDVRASGAGSTPPPWLEREIVLNGARLSVAMGRPEDALAAVETLDDPGSHQSVIVTAAALVAQGEMGRGSELVKPIVDLTGLPTPLLIEAWLVLAVAASERGDASAVRETLGRALALAAPDAHRRAFHEAGFRLRHLLRSDAGLASAYRSLDASAVPKSSRRSGGARPPAYAPIVVDPLSVRELQVLRYLAGMLGTEEIADTMYLSVNTVKTHVRSILRKLAVSRRNEAVRRARELGLV